MCMWGYAKWAAFEGLFLILNLFFFYVRKLQHAILFAVPNYIHTFCKDNLLNLFLDFLSPWFLFVCPFRYRRDWR